MGQVSVAAEVDESVSIGFDDLANATGRTRAELIADALATYAESERDFLAAVAVGVREAESGNFMDHEDVVRSVRGIATRAR